MLLALCGLVGLLAGAFRVLSKEDSATRDSDLASLAKETEASTPSAFSKSKPRASKPSAEIPKLLSALRTGTTEQTTLALEVLLPDLMKRDITAAAELADGLEAWASREQVLLKIAGTWAEEDPDAALNWSRRLPDAGERQNCLVVICQKLSLSDPARAVALAETLPNAGNFLLLAGLCGPWMAQDPEAAAEWIAKQGSTGVRDLCWMGGISELAKKSPEQAANLAVDKIESERFQTEAVISVLHQWVLQDRKAAAEWVELFPAGPLRTRAEGELKGRH